MYDVDKETENLINIYMKYTSCGNLCVDDFLKFRKQVIKESQMFNNKHIVETEVEPIVKTPTVKPTKVQTAIKTEKVKTSEVKENTNKPKEKKPVVEKNDIEESTDNIISMEDMFLAMVSEIQD